MLHKYDEVSKGLVYVGKLFPNEANEEYLQETFGGGRWRCQERVRDERGSFNIARTRTITLAGLPKRVEDMPIRKNVTAAAAAAEVGTLNAAGDIPRGNTKEVLDAAMVSQVMDLLKMSKEVRTNPGDDPVMKLVLSQMTSMQTAMMEMMKAVAAPREEGGGLMAVVLPLLVDLFKTKERTEAPTSMVQMIEALRSLKDLRDDVNDEGKGGAPMWDTASRALSVVETLAAQRTVQPNPPTGARPVATPNQPTPPQVAQPLWAILIQRSKGLLLSVAKRGVPPEDAASSMLTMMPEDQLGILKEFLSLPDAVSTLFNLVPEMQNFPAWTQGFVAALVEQLSDDTEEEDDPSLDADTPPE